MDKQTKSIGRLEKILKKIDDPKIKDIVLHVIDVEISYRSADRNYFPWKKIRDIIDDVAREIDCKQKPINLL